MLVLLRHDFNIMLILIILISLHFQGSRNQGVGFLNFVTEKYVTIIDSKMYHALSLSVHPEK